MIAILPTPDGQFHAGNLSTYLAAWCLARQTGLPLLVLPDATRGAYPDADMRRWYDRTRALLAAYNIPPDQFLRPEETYALRSDKLPTEVLDRCYPCTCGPPMPLPVWYPRDPCATNLAPGDSPGAKCDESPGAKYELRVRGPGVWAGTVHETGEVCASRAVEHVVFQRHAGLRGGSWIVRGRDLEYHTKLQMELCDALCWDYPRVMFVPVLQNYRFQKLCKSSGASPVWLWSGSRLALLRALWSAMQPGATAPDTLAGMAAQFDPVRINPENYRLYDVIARYCPEHVRDATQS